MLQDILHNGIDVVTHPLLAFVALSVIHFVVGKKFSFPLGVLSGYSPLAIGIIATVCDVLLIIVLMYVFEIAGDIKFIRRMKERRKAKSERRRGSKRFQLFKNMGRVGIVLVLIIPFTGGVYSAALIQNILKIRRWEGIGLALLGMLIGNAIFVLSFLGVLKLMN